MRHSRDDFTAYRAEREREEVSFNHNEGAYLNRGCYDSSLSNVSLNSDCDIAMDQEQNVVMTGYPNASKKKSVGISRDVTSIPPPMIPQRTRARAKKTHEPDPFLCVGPTRQPTRIQPLSGQTRSSMSTDMGGPINTPQSRQRSTATISSVGTWNPLVPRRQRKEYMEAVMHNPPNHHVKAPFKQLVMDEEEDDIIIPEQVLKEKTAMATYLVARAMAKQQLVELPKPQGRLLKGKLKPLYPVKVEGPTIVKCRGVVSEARTYSASPSRTLQRRRRILNNLSQDMHERPQTVESIHQTSIASDLSENRDQELKQDLDAIDNEKENHGPQITENETEDKRTQSANSGKNSRESEEEEGAADKSDAKSVRFFMNGEDEKLVEEAKLIEDFQGEDSAPYDGSCDKDVSTEEATCDNDNCNNNSNGNEKNKQPKVGKHSKRPQSAKKSSYVPTVSSSVESFWEMDVGSQRQPVYNTRPKSKLGLWENPQRPESDVTDLNITGVCRSFESARLSREDDAGTSRDFAEFDGPYVKSSALRVFGKKERPQSAGPLQYLIDQKKKLAKKQRPVSATPWRNIKLNTSGCITARSLHLNERANMPASEMKTPKQLNATFRPSPNARPFSARAAKLHQPTGKKKLKTFSKCSYCGCRTEKVSYAKGLYFNVCQKCLLQTRQPTSRSQPHLEVHGHQVSVDRKTPSPVSSEQLSDVACLAVSEALRNLTRDFEGDEAASEAPSEALSEIAEGVVSEVLRSVAGSEILRLLAEKVLTLVNKELSQRMQVMTVRFPDDLCMQLGNLAKEVIMVMRDQYQPGDELKILDFTDDQLEGMAKLAVAAVLDEIDELLGSLAADEEEEAPPLADEDEIDHFAATIVADVMDKVKMRSVAVDQVDQNCASEKSMSSGTDDVESKLLTNLEDLDESLNQVQKEIHECIVRSQSRNSTNPEPNTATPPGHNSYNLTVYQYNEVSSESEEVTMDEEVLSQEAHGEISQYEVTLKRERSLLDENTMDGRMLDILCNQLSTSLKDEKKDGKKIPKRTLENTPLEVVASAKALYRARSAKNPENSGYSPQPPLCFKVNARPPRGYLYYFAYGMDMNPERFSNNVQRRIKERFWGLLYGFRMVFNKRGADDEAGSFPNIEFDPTSSVEGCIYLISPDELDLLDASTGYPQHFEHVMMPVWLLNCSSPDEMGVAQYCVPALMYIAQNEWIDNGGKLDSSYAASQCMKGADILSPAYKDHLAKFQ